MEGSPQPDTRKVDSLETISNPHKNPVKCYYPHFSEEEAVAQKVMLLLIEPIVATSAHSHTAT